MSPSLPKSYRVAVFKEKGQPLSLEEVELKEPIGGEVLIKVEACGVCHSDAYVKEGAMGNSLPVLFLRPLAAAADFPPVPEFRVMR